jgi:hypothetical protein
VSSVLHGRRLRFVARLGARDIFARHTGDRVRKAPRRSDRIATLIERDGWTARVSLFSDDRDVQTVTALINRIVLAFLGGVVESSRGFCLTRRGGPSFVGNTTLFQFFGYFGLFCSSALILRVIVAILDDRSNQPSRKNSS